MFFRFDWLGKIKLFLTPKQICLFQCESVAG